ncbi:MAG TPA: acyl-CoA dehydrogenase family protein, partial [Pseudomonadales bacterium]|nr:acyl-CoA dehydrogenase family protein [Pseudomonadales bacterium]
MSFDPTGLALNVLNRVAGSDLPDKLGIRKTMEKLLYSGTKAGFRFATTTARKFTGSGNAQAATRLQAPGQTTDLFDLNITQDQQIMRDTLQRFAADVIRPAAHAADEAATLPAAVLEAAKELGLAFYAVPEALGGVATENMVVSNMLIAEDLAHGDMGLALALLSPL